MESETSTFGDIVFDETTSPVLYPQVVLMRCKSRFFKDVEHFCGLPSPTTSTFAPADKFYALHLGGFRWVARIDRTDWPKSLRPTPINGQPNVVGAFFDFDASPEFQQMKQWMTDEQHNRLDAYFRKQPEIHNLYLFKDELKAFLMTKNKSRKALHKEGLIAFFMRLLQQLEATGFDLFKTLGKTLKSWQQEILRMFVFP